LSCCTDSGNLCCSVMPWFVAQACQGLIRLLHQRETASFVRVALKSAPRPNSVTALTATGARQTLEQEAYEKALLERKFPMFRPGDVVEVKLVRCPPNVTYWLFAAVVSNTLHSGVQSPAPSQAE